MCYFYFFRIDTTPTPHYTNQFSIEVDTGNVIISPDPETALRYIVYEYDKSRYVFSVKFIPHQRGVFLFGFGSEPQQHVNFQKKCPGELMDIYFTTNDGVDNNFYMMAQSPDSSMNAVPQHGFNRSGSYCFRVVE
ncbi:hypothetical protein B6N25_10795 [Sphingobacteriales bacterium TSM_CSS]|nr:hypothetical protein B6N25_10795 [Sphingobacteriales bacterium TSM_CSS]